MNYFNKNRKVILFIFCGLIIAGFLFFYKTRTTYGELPSNIKVEGDSLFAQDINVAGQSLKGTEGFDWIQMKKIMVDNATRLEENFGKKLTNISTTMKELNPDSKPEGQVWVYGDNNYNKVLTINEATIKGKGTIIVKGNLIISGDLSYDDEKNDSIGFIVLNKGEKGGNITIEKNVDTTVGIFYSTKKITFITE